MIHTIQHPAATQTLELELERMHLKLYLFVYLSGRMPEDIANDIVVCITTMGLAGLSLCGTILIMSSNVSL